jgi:ABC-type sugar transport system ATPase subunit
MIHCKDLHIKQGDFILDGINFRIKKGDYAVMMGKTGCGKTTILESVCGLRNLVSGEIWLNGEEVSNFTPAQREIGYLPQDNALFKTLTVAQNIGFALKLRKWNKDKIEERVNELAKSMEITKLLKRKADDLSGGERQRVALARALSFYPEVLCLDEPLSALDENTLQEMYELLTELKNNNKITVLHISHSKTDAIKLADQVLMFKNGALTDLNPNEL